MEKATFAAGCFWGVEDAFRAVQGVHEAVVGYCGGSIPDPGYERVCGGGTGHAESVEVSFDPQEVSYADLLDVFWSMHDPTTLNRQGPDVGTQYRSAIFYHDEAQKEMAEGSKESLEASRKHERPVVTEIAPALPFYRAEEYHQSYLAKRGLGSCHAPRV